MICNYFRSKKKKIKQIQHASSIIKYHESCSFKIRVFFVLACGSINRALPAGSVLHVSKKHQMNTGEY